MTLAIGRGYGHGRRALDLTSLHIFAISSWLTSSVADRKAAQCVGDTDRADINYCANPDRHATNFPSTGAPSALICVGTPFVFLDRSATGGRFPVQASVLARMGAMLLGAGPGLLVLAFLATLHFGSQTVSAHAFAAGFHPGFVQADGVDLAAAGGKVASHPYVETIRRMSRVSLVRTTDTHLAIAQSSPSISAGVFVGMSCAAPLADMNETRGCILSARAPPQATYIL